MGKVLMLQEEDYSRISSLQVLLGKTKIDIVRAGVALLEQEVLRQQKIAQWKKAAAIVGDSGMKVNKAFQKNSRLRRDT